MLIASSISVADVFSTILDIAKDGGGSFWDWPRVRITWEEMGDENGSEYGKPQMEVVRFDGMVETLLTSGGSVGEDKIPGEDWS